MSNQNNIIRSILLTEAEEKIRERVKKGEKLDTALKEISDDMELSDDETNDLQSVFNEPQKALSTPDNPYPNAIYFNNPEDVDSAVGVLMYNNIPWDSKNSEDGSYIQFGDQASLSKAITSLNRKWDFIDNKKDNIASISFDNIADYKKVLDFITKSGMFINFDNSIELDEDVSIDKKTPIDTNGRSFRAENKKIKEKIDPIKNKEQRSLVVRKRYR
ncbi:MAG: hypothetical protein [Caudoviricetes sp.]|nr:MAG: hypothetical protein [Caudoviricetes sp.]